MDGIDPWEFLSWLLYGVDLCLSRSSELEYYWFVYITLRRTRLGSVCVFWSLSPSLRVSWHTSLRSSVSKTQSFRGKYPEGNSVTVVDFIVNDPRMRASLHSQYMSDNISSGSRHSHANDLCAGVLNWGFCVRTFSSNYRSSLSVCVQLIVVMWVVQATTGVPKSQTSDGTRHWVS